MIEIQNLSKVFDRKIFSHLNLQFPDHQFTVFLGPSGCGKSTLLKMMANLDTPTSGRILGLQEKKKSIVFQEPRLLPWLNCRENILISESLKSQVHESSVQTRYLDLLQKISLIDAQDFFPSQLSGGMKMRTAIARALMQNPQVLFLDEPFSALDEPTRLFLQEELRQLFIQNSWTTFFVTHSIEEAIFLADQVVVFKNAETAPFIFNVDLPETRNQSTRSEMKYFELVSELRKKVRNG